MQLILFRHGIAEEQSPDGRDESRALTPAGVKKTRRAANGLARILPRPDLILTSPRVRALQTALILGQVLDRKPQPLPELGEGPAQALLRKLGARHESLIVLVGHEPTLSRLAEAACWGKVQNRLVLKKAGAACVEFAAGEVAAGMGCLKWLATPGMLRAMAR